MSAVSWLLRVCLGLGGIVLAFVAWPVATSAFYAQQADVVVGRLRDGRPINLPATLAAIDALDQAVRIDPTASRDFQRSELLAGAAGQLEWAAADSQRIKWLETAAADLERGLARAPARGVAWLRLASVRYSLGGPSENVAVPLLISIETAPIVQRLWPARIELIFRDWAVYSDDQRDRIGEYLAMLWRQSTDRRWIVRSMRRPEDELYLRYFLKDVPGAQDEFMRWLASDRQ